MLRRLGIEHRVVHYDHDPDHGSFGLEAVEALGTDPDGTFKTLMVTLDDGRNAIGVVPVSCTLDLKAIAAAAGAKKARMTEPASAERRSGYVVGGISPFGQSRSWRRSSMNGRRRWTKCSAAVAVAVLKSSFPPTPSPSPSRRLCPSQPGPTDPSLH